MADVLITGATGFLGRAVSERIPGARCLSSSDLDLTDGRSVLEAVGDWNPTVVIHLAARVGGISANIARQADFLVDNLRMDANLLAAMRTHAPDHFVPLLSTCMYPDRLPAHCYPLTEDMVEEGPPPPTNAAYAAAKRALWHGSLALADQYGVPYSALIPSNLYGPGDHFGSRESHFLAAAVQKIEDARRSSVPMVEFMGTGRALRQFLFVRDLADLIAHLVNHEPLNTTVNVAPSHNLSIAQLARAVADAAGYDGDIRFSGEGPDGQLRKDVTVERLLALVPQWESIETPLDSGLSLTLDWYREHVEPS